MKYKNSTLFLKDWAILIKSLPTEKQLVFWDMFMQYPDSVCDDDFVKPIWNFIELQLNNMNEKYQDTIVKRNQENGLKGGRPPKKTIENEENTQTQQNPKNPMGLNETQKTLNENVNENENENNNENENKKVNNIEERKLKFADTLKPFVEKYGRELIIEFYNYWTEPNKSKTKFKQELLKTWDTQRRLETWVKNDFNFKKEKVALKTKNEQASDKFIEVAQRNVEIYEQMKLNNEL